VSDTIVAGIGFDTELDRVIPLETEKADKESVRKITSLSPDSIKRNYKKYVVQLSPRREGMSRRNAFLIAAGKAAKS
jgi:hypothetical protein